MKKKQVRNLVVALGLVAALGGGATLALLSAQSNVVTNTFTVGKNLQDSDLKLDEYALNTDNRTANKDTERVINLAFDNLMQGDVLDKDPTVQIKSDAAECYMFVKITGLDALKEKGITVNWNSSWAKADGQSTFLDGIYYYTGGTNGVVDPSTLTDNISPEDGFGELPSLFTKVTVANDADLYDDNGEGKKLDSIVAKACAVQAQNVDSWNEAYTQLPSGFTN